MADWTRRQVLLSTAGLAAAKPARPFNFVFILIDDLGATDLGCYGSRYYETPHIDSLASQGVRFTQAYSACTVCSPSRAAILTGKYPARLHITDFIPGTPYPWTKLKPPDWTQHLPLEEITIAKALKPAGYASASIGKWHLGGEEYYPEKHGFDRNIGGTHIGQPPSYFSPYRIPTLPDGPPGEYLSDRQAAEAIRFIEQNKDRPFFLYLPFYAVHTPLQAKKDAIARYQAKGDAQGKPVYAAMIDSVDENVGRLLAALDRLNIADRTVVVFNSDNGGLIGSTSNIGLREGKGAAYEGGIRVPLLVRWPGVTRPGSVCNVPVSGIDFHPTFLEMAGLRAAPGQIIDGVSLAPLLRGGNKLRRDTLYWHYPHYHPGGATPYSAIRKQDLKLIEYQEDDRVELYNLARDPLEKNDLASSDTRQRDALRRQLHNWREEVGAQMALPNPDYDPARARERGRR